MNWKEKAAKHAKECLPKECCGLLAIVKGKEIYFPCKNLANDQISYFIIDPDDWAKAEDSGELVGLIHSHPKGSIFPSDNDKAACEYLGLPFHIYSPEMDDWYSFKPSGYKPSSIIGRTWIWGAADCWTIVVDYFKDKGIDVVDMIRPKSPYEMLTNNKFETEIPSCNFVEVDDDIREDDLLLFSMGKSKGCHVGIYVGDQMVLHHQVDRLSSKDLLDSQMQKSIYKKYRHVENN